jgi:hypothetical protein
MDKVKIIFTLQVEAIKLTDSKVHYIQRMPVEDTKL